MNRYMRNPKSGVLAIIDVLGRVDFRNERGFPTKEDMGVYSAQEVAVDALRGMGFEEGTGL